MSTELLSEGELTILKAADGVLNSLAERSRDVAFAMARMQGGTADAISTAALGGMATNCREAVAQVWVAVDVWRSLVGARHDTDNGVRVER